MDHGDISMVLESNRQVRNLRATREPETIKWIEKNINTEDVFYDIGANVGEYSLAAWGHSRCKVYSFEPSFSTFSALSRNIFLNKSSNRIRPFQVALGEKTGLRFFNYNGLTAGQAGHSMADNPEVFNKGPTQTVIAYTLDDFITQFNISPPNYMKIDVDGGELSVLGGAKETLKNPSLRSVLVEVDKTIESYKDILSLLKSAGFREEGKHGRPNGDVFNYIFTRTL
jgi:FkbM family methyltransferase